VDLSFIQDFRPCLELNVLKFNKLFNLASSVHLPHFCIRNLLLLHRLLQSPLLHQFSPPTPGQPPQGYSPPKPTAQIPTFTLFCKPRTEKKYQKPSWMVNNKTQHFKYDQAFQVYAATFRLKDFPTLIKAAFSVVTAEVEKDHQSTLLCFVTIVQLWFKMVSNTQRRPLNRFI